MKMTAILTGYLALESLDADEEDSQICGLCGIVPEAILGEWILVDVKLSPTPHSIMVYSSRAQASTGYPSSA
jgi:hypothetical protein